jgi:hypothetical protein
VDIHVLDATWRGVVGVRDALFTWTTRPGMTLRVDLAGLDTGTASAFWLSALASFTRIARVRGCRLVVGAAPAQLASGFTRLRLAVLQNDPAASDPL